MRPSMAMTREAQQAITPDEALAMLKRGNQRFLQDKMVNRDYAAQVKQTSRGQFPLCLHRQLPGFANTSGHRVRPRCR